MFAQNFTCYHRLDSQLFQLVGTRFYHYGGMIFGPSPCSIRWPVGIAAFEPYQCSILQNQHKRDSESLQRDQPISGDSSLQVRQPRNAKVPQYWKHNYQTVPIWFNQWQHLVTLLILSHEIHNHHNHHQSYLRLSSFFAPQDKVSMIKCL